MNDFITGLQQKYKEQRIKCLRIPVGLPASGKSTFYNNLRGKLGTNLVTIIDENLRQTPTWIPEQRFDRTEPMNDNQLMEDIGVFLPRYGRQMTFIVDGLFLTTARVMRVIDCVLHKAHVDEIVIDLWNEDKEECKRNDYNRRRLGSSLAIDTLSINVDIAALQEKYNNLTIEQHQVYHTPDYVLYFRQFTGGTATNEKVLKSTPWVVNGTAYNVHGEASPVDADTVPDRFHELDKMLLMIDKNFPLKKAMEIQQRCVEVITTEESDYYLNVTKDRYECNLEKLYELLTEWGYTDNTSEKGNVLHLFWRDASWKHKGAAENYNLVVDMDNRTYKVFVNPFYGYTEATDIEVRRKSDIRKYIKYLVSLGFKAESI